MKPERIRDPIHDLIVFDENDPVDTAVWQMLESPDVQRLRRIKQLGVSEFVYPSASHTRFAHSVGVFHNARRLVRIINREIKEKRVEGEFNPHRAKVAMFAALLHDIGHGPFSHAFEEARKSIAELRGDGSGKAKIRKHEAYTADMIEDPAGLLGEIISEAKVEPKEVAELIRAENPTDMYHAIVSSSFDADRLDYLQRDRYMTGSGTGAIDIGWLMSNVRVAEIDVTPPGDDGGEPIYVHSFCLNYKSRDAAEDFLLARYRLYTNVYFHKATRGFEQLLSAFFRHIAECISNGIKVKGIEDNSPLLHFFTPGGETLENYRSIDDTVVWGTLHQVAANGENYGKNIANRILGRHRPPCLDVQIKFPEDSERQRRFMRALNIEFQDEFGKSVFRDNARLSIYGEIGADDGRAQKRLMIQLANEELKEITDFNDATITGSERQRFFDRYYFLNESEIKKALATLEQVRGRHR